MLLKTRSARLVPCDWRDWTRCPCPWSEGEHFVQRTLRRRTVMHTTRRRLCWFVRRGSCGVADEPRASYKYSVVTVNSAETPTARRHPVIESQPRVPGVDHLGLACKSLNRTQIASPTRRRHPPRDTRPRPPRPSSAADPRADSRDSQYPCSLDDGQPEPAMLPAL